MNEENWRTRLWRAIENDPRTDRALSMAAGLGENYVQQLRERKGAPKIDAAEKLCDALGITLVYLLTGVPMDKDGEEFLRLAGQTSSKNRHHLLNILRPEEPEDAPD